MEKWPPGVVLPVNPSTLRVTKHLQKFDPSGHPSGAVKKPSGNRIQINGWGACRRTEARGRNRTKNARSFVDSSQQFPMRKIVVVPATHSGVVLMVEQRFDARRLDVSIAKNDV